MKPENIIIYLLIINVITFIVFGTDKHAAIYGKWRTKEATLFLLAFFGGSLGALLAMKVFRHKTKKAEFLIGIPVLLVVNIIVIAYIFIPRSFAAFASLAKYLPGPSKDKV